MARQVVVIGTGVGGLAAAAYLAKSGLDVLALEQAEQLGGYTNPFSRDGFHFDTGVHYVGECRPGQTIHDVLAGVGIDAGSLFCELDPDGFDVYRFPAFEVRLCRGLDAYRARLADDFPAERAAVERFFDLVHAMSDALGAIRSAQLQGPQLAQLKAIRHLPSVLRWQSHTFGELLETLTADRRLRAVLAAAGGDYGLPPARASALAGVMLFAHYADGGFFPRGGSGALRDALVHAAEREGARFRTRARVERILTRDGRVGGVQLEGGERIDADVVVSDVDPVVTLGRLVDAALLPRALRDKVQRTEPSLATFAIYLGMRRDLRRHGLGSFNVWDYPDVDIDASYAPLFAGELPREPILFLSPASLKDDSGSLAPPGSSTLEIVTNVPYSIFERWSDRPVGARGAEYEEEKRRVGDWLIAAVARRWPGLVGDVVVQEMSTPLTNESYVGAVRGGAYGPALTPRQTGFHRFRPRTPIDNLFLAGAGVFGDGIALGLLSGRVAARLAVAAGEPRRGLRSAAGARGSGDRGSREAPPRPTDQLVDVDDLRVRYWSTGEEHPGVPILMLHGLGAYAETWSYNVASLARHRRVLVVDLPGFGRTSVPARPLDLRAQARFVVAFLDALGLARATLFGHSMGGGVALRVAIDFPERVDQLVLVSPLGFGGRICWQLEIMRLPLVGELLSRPSLRASRRLGFLAVEDPALVTPEIVETSYAYASRPGGRGYTLAATRALLGSDTAMVTEFSRIRAPTLIVWGAQDRVLPLSAARDPSKTFPRARLHVFDPCGHMAMFERPEEFNALALEFLTAGSERSTATAAGDVASDESAPGAHP